MTASALPNTHYPGMHFAYAELSDIRIHYAYAGKTDHTKPLLLCLHGFPEFWRTWQHQLRTLAKEYFVVAPDLRGYNLSAKPKPLAAYSINHLVNDALELVSHLGYQTFFLAGHDWGGNIAWTLASQHPEQVKKLTIINSPHPRIFQKLLGTNPQQIQASSYFLKFLDDAAEEKLSRNNFDLLWRFGFSELVEKEVFNSEDFIAHQAAWSQPGCITAMLALYREARFHVAELTEVPVNFPIDHLPANYIDIPTQVIWGMDDTALTPACLDGMEEYVSDLKILPIANAGHGIIHEYPDLISQHLSQFFT